MDLIPFVEVLTQKVDNVTGEQVDDFLLGSTDLNLLEECQEFLQKTFKVKCTENIEKFVGLQLKNQGKELFLHQEDMIMKIGLKRRIEKVFPTPLIYNLKCNEKSTSLENRQLIQQIFGELKYIADIAYNVKKIARRLHNPTKEVFRSAKRILGYLVGTSDCTLSYKHTINSDWKMKVYTDASFADIITDRYKSTGGYIIFLEDNIVGWKSKKLRYVCTSSSESEYIAAYIGCKEALFLAYIILEVFGKNIFPVKLMCDNKAVVDILKKSAPGEMTKYMQTKFYKLKEWTEEKLIEVQQVSSGENIADIMTKVDGRYNYFQQMILEKRGSGVFGEMKKRNLVPLREADKEDQ